ncbi:MAG: hypothetical protein ACC628_08930 [Pirellulaceae bacterium]
MRKRTITWVMPVATAALFVILPTHRTVAGPFPFFGWFGGHGVVDVHSHECDECGGIHDPDGPCIERYPVEKCVIGKKELFKSKIGYEWVSIPETRYHWKTMKITKEIPCPYCKPVCKTEDAEHCFGEEKWTKECDECGQLHCKHIEQKLEKVVTKQCDHEPGETTIKAKYWSCVKVPYVVYRQVRQPVCVKQPYYEKVKVPITKYVCEHCDDGGSSECEHCDGEGCSECDH